MPQSFIAQLKSKSAFLSCLPLPSVVVWWRDCVCACLNGVFCESELTPTSHLDHGECMEQSHDPVLFLCLVFALFSDKITVDTLYLKCFCCVVHCDMNKQIAKSCWIFLWGLEEKLQNFSHCIWYCK